MRRILPLLFALAASVCHAADANIGHLLPIPMKVQTGGKSFALHRAVSLDVAPAFATEFCAEGDNALSRYLAAARLKASSKAKATLSIRCVSNIAGAYDYPLPHFDNEAYSIAVDRHRIDIAAVTRTGAIRALQTLQLLLADYPTTLPGMTITDWPAFKVRGLMHDLGRSYLSLDELRQEIDLLARFKVNVFFWHLTDKHGFRFESRRHPEVNTNFSPTRTSQVYTQQECRQLQDYAYSRGMTVIPEIDMPGHSARFEGATGHTMVSPEGRQILKDVLQELVSTFDKAPYIHIGGDETADATEEYINEMADHVHSLGRKVAVWNCYKYPFTHVDPNVIHADLSTNWATAGTLSPGLPNIDMRYFYLNHIDVFADVAAFYRSSIFYQDRGNADVAGIIDGIWNDRLISDEALIVRQNNLYAALLATAERAWQGGQRPYIEQGGSYIPNDGPEYDAFADWERRFLFHKATTLSAAADKIPYVRQTNVRWMISPAYDNHGDKTASFPIETLDDLTSQPGTPVTGAGIWLNHIWAGIVPGALGSEPQPMNQTRYAWTYVYSPKAQTLGAFVSTYDYSRSDRGTAAPDGQWDMRGSRIWINNTEIIPHWHWTTDGYEEETELGNANFTAREPLKIKLEKGWNKILLKLPLVPSAHQRPAKWHFTFVLTDPAGRNAAPGIIYSPTKTRR